MKKTQLVTGLKRATIEILMLKILSEADQYGYQLTQELKKRSGGCYTIQEGSMYPILYRLRDRECISLYEKKGMGHQIRVYYHLEEKGKEYRRLLTEAYYGYMDLVSFMLESHEGEVYNQEGTRAMKALEQWLEREEAEAARKAAAAQLAEAAEDMESWND